MTAILVDKYIVEYECVTLCVLFYAYIHIHIHIYIYVYVYIHVHVQANLSGRSQSLRGAEDFPGTVTA